jgi:hypothetical protein
MKRKAPTGGGRPARGRGVRKAESGIEVTPEEQERLIDDLAFFHAERHRRIRPGGYREEDRHAAEAEIQRILKKRVGR